MGVTVTFFRRQVIDVFWRIISCAFFGTGLFVFRWNGMLVLLGFWIEEVVAWAGIAFQRRMIIRRLKAGGQGCEGEDEPGTLSTNALYGIFAAYHLLIILIFIAVDAKNNSASHSILLTLWGCITFRPELVNMQILSSTGWMFLTFIIMMITDTIKSLNYGADSRRATLKSLDEKNRAVMTLPYITILLGGFALGIFHSRQWIAIGLLAGKCICELILLPITRKDEREYEEVRKE